MPRHHAERLASSLGRQVRSVEGSSVMVPYDQPAVTAAAITAFARGADEPGRSWSAAQMRELMRVDDEVHVVDARAIGVEQPHQPWVVVRIRRCPRCR